MSTTKPNVLCYLRTHRRVWGLSQPELASLLGLKSPSHVSRIENGKYAPTLEVALACQMIFGVPPSAMFPHVYLLVEEDVVRNAYNLHLELGSTNSLSGLRKRELCDLVLERAVSKSNALEGI